ncbi:MAG: hypothetical protein GY797_20765 [Deltaproteobacteria bacterium]|nr:hypothetical protein [Deltaproteobacteria bacterium]
MKMNCWEYKKCGREPGGDKIEELGLCPAATSEKMSTVNQGTNAGRICWIISGTLCNKEVQGEFTKKLGNCTKCDFFKKVFDEEGSEFNYGIRLLSKLKNN